MVFVKSTQLTWNELDSRPAHLVRGEAEMSEQQSAGLSSITGTTLGGFTLNLCCAVCGRTKQIRFQLRSGVI